MIQMSFGCAGVLVGVKSEVWYAVQHDTPVYVVEGKLDIEYYTNSYVMDRLEYNSGVYTYDLPEAGQDFVDGFVKFLRTFK